MNDQVDIQTPGEFLSDFITRIRSAKRRIWAQAMLMETGLSSDGTDPIEVLIKELVHAKKRGVPDVKMVIDNFSLVSTYCQPDWWLTFDTKEKEIKQTLRKKKYTLLDQLLKSGIEVTICNPHRHIQHIIPEIGRNHIKNYGVDDVAWLGGGNMQTDWFNCQDLMVRHIHPKIVKALRDHFMRDFEKQPIRQDHALHTDPEHTLYFDGGISGSSLIYTHALSMMNKARHRQDRIRFISQYPPTGKILDKLVEKAKTGVTVDIILSDKQDPYISVKLSCRLMYFNFLRKIHGIDTIRFRHYPGKIHAKLLIVEHGKGTATVTEALHGSHNLERAGVLLGTQELAIHTKNPLELKHYQNFYDKTFSKGYTLEDASNMEMIRSTPTLPNKYGILA